MKMQNTKKDKGKFLIQALKVAATIGFFTLLFLNFATPLQSFYLIILTLVLGFLLGFWVVSVEISKEPATVFQNPRMLYQSPWVKWVLVPAFLLVLGLGLFFWGVSLIEGSDLILGTAAFQAYPVPVIILISVFFLGYLILRIYYDCFSSQEEKFLNFFSKNLFLLFLLCIAVISFDFSLFGESVVNYVEPLGLEVLEKVLVYPTILIGFIAFYKNRGIIEQRVEEEQKQEKLAEQTRAKEFSAKHPRLLGIPILGNFTQFFYKLGCLYSFLLLILILIGFSVRLYRLGALSLWYDENITGSVLRRIHETGIPLEPSGARYYWRGVTFHYFVSIFTLIFGLTEFWLRFPNVLLGIGVIFLTFLLSKKINKYLALLTVLFLVFCPYHIEYSRFSRFYMMNTFLYLLTLVSVYKGFLQNKKIYKLLYFILALLMVHTVQLGRFFIFIFGSYFVVNLLIEITNEKFSMSSYTENNIKKLYFLLPSLVIAYIGNFFKSFIGLRKHEIQYAYETLESVPEPSYIEHSLLNWPVWYLPNFMNQNYLPFVFVILGLVILFVFIKDTFKKLETNKQYLTFLYFSFLFSWLGYEILNGGAKGPRLYLFLVPFIIIITFTTIFFILNLYFKKKNIIRGLLFTIVLFFLINISPKFYTIISREYGEDTSSDPFRSSHCAIFRADLKNPYEYLNKHMKEEDIFISLAGTPYFYIKRSPDYIINQSYGWNARSIYDDSNNFVTVRGSILINNAEKLSKLLNQNNKRIWLVVNARHTELTCTTYLQDIRTLLENYENNIIYVSPDGISRIYLIESN